VTAETQDDTTNTDIREIPEGMVSTKDVIEAFKAAGERYEWCGGERHYLAVHTPIKFMEQAWDPVIRCYLPEDRWTLTYNTPEFVSKEDIETAIKAGMRDHPYKARSGVPELNDKLGLSVPVYEDKWTVTIQLTTTDLLEQNTEIDDDENQSTQEFTAALRSAITSKFYDRNGYLDVDDNEHVENGTLRIVRTPDPRRALG
jgi:hypothetical protein